MVIMYCCWKSVESVEDGMICALNFIGTLDLRYDSGSLLSISSLT